MVSKKEKMLAALKLEAREELLNIPDYIPGKSIDEIREKYKLKNIIKLASNENPFGASPLAIAAYKECSKKLNLYPRGAAPELVAKLAKKWLVKQENIIIGNGSDEILDLAARAYLNKGDLAAGAISTFSVYSSVTQSVGAIYKAFDLNQFHYPLEELLSFKETKVIFICNPNNPTGTFYPNKDIYKYLQTVPKNVLIVLDMAYAEFTYEKEAHINEWIREFPNLLCTRTFSKLYGLAGLRIGYGIASKEIISNLKKIKPPFNSNYPAQMAAKAALNDRVFIEKSLRNNFNELLRLKIGLQKKGFKILPSAANFICVKFGENAAKMVKKLEKNGIIIRHLESFGMPDWVRITIGTASENKALISLL